MKPRFVCVALLVATLVVPAMVRAQQGNLSQAMAFYDEATRLLRAGRRPDAIVAYQRGLEIVEKVLGPNHPTTASSVSGLAAMYAAAGAWDQALLHYKRALSIREKSQGPDHPDTIGSVIDLAGLYQDTSAFAQARPLRERVLAFDERTKGPEDPDTGRSLNSLAIVQMFMGNADKALSHLRRALAIHEKALGPEHAETAAVLNNLGAIYRHMGASAQALASYRRALQIREKAQGVEHPDTAEVAGNLGQVYRDMGAYDQALPLLQRVVNTNEKQRGADAHPTGVSLNNLAMLYVSMGSFNLAVPLLERALAVFVKVLPPGHQDLRRIRQNLGYLYIETKDDAKADTYIRLSGDKAVQAQLFLARGQYGAALRLFELPEFRPTAMMRPAYHAQHLTDMGTALNGLKRHRPAAEALFQAVQRIETLREKTAGERDTFFAAASYMRAYRGLVSALAELGQSREELPGALRSYGPDAAAAAFYFAEATKARRLLEVMADAARKESRADIPAATRLEEESLTSQLAAVEVQWENALQGGQTVWQAHLARADALNRQLDALIARLRRDYPLYAALHYPRPLPAAELPLRDGEVLLEYAVGDEASYLFVVRKGGVQQVVKLPVGRRVIETQVQAFMQPLLNAQGAGFSIAHAKALYDLLLAPAQVKEDERVIVIPDGVLGLLPFEALVITPGADERDAVYVGDRYALSYNQSATVFALQRALATPSARRPLFALGNPVFSEKDPRYVAFRSGTAVEHAIAAPSDQLAFRGLATRREWGKTTKGSATGSELVFPPLPETEREVTTIAGVLGVAPGPPDVLTGVAATETGLRRAPLGDYRVLHFATHADLPGRMQGIKEPFLLLGQVGNQGTDDGLLTMSEVLELKLRADLVVLSACVTGRGAEMDGEGVANFARAFQYAGARTVVVSLWEVASEPAVDYMTTFYGHLKAGKPSLESLRLARQALKAKYPNPFYWAVFILHGEG